MAEEVKPQPRRRYDTTRRQAQAAQTRQDIVAAAQRVFLERGYSGATLTAIAQAAGVVVETIYRGFGSKASLFKVVVRAAVAGGAARAAPGHPGGDRRDRSPPPVPALRRHPARYPRTRRTAAAGAGRGGRRRPRARRGLGAAGERAAGRDGPLRPAPGRPWRPAARAVGRGRP